MAWFNAMALRRMAFQLAALAGIAMGCSSAMGVVSYIVPAPLDGNQGYGGNLGMSFDVAHSVIITQLGVFDDDQDGLTTTLNAQLWNRATQTSLALLTFTPGDPGTLVGGSRFKTLATPLILPAGFQGLISAGGFNAANENGNQGSVDLGATTNSGGGLLTFVAQNRFHSDSTNALSFPDQVDGASPINRYLAGTFNFESANIAYEVSSGAVGGQNFGGPVGMDFQSNAQVKITHLGVFDSGGDGINGGTLTAQLWIRNENGTPTAFGDDTGTLAAQISFTGNQGDLIGGSRFLEINESNYLNGFNGYLAPGVNASIVVFGFNAVDPLGNVNAFTGTKTTFDGFGALTFEGVARFGVTPGLFPGSTDGGPANRYAAGTFLFVVVPEPATGMLLLLGVAGLASRKRRIA